MIDYSKYFANSAAAFAEVGITETKNSGDGKYVYATAERDISTVEAFATVRAEAVRDMLRNSGFQLPSLLAENGRQLPVRINGDTNSGELTVIAYDPRTHAVAAHQVGRASLGKAVK